METPRQLNLAGITMKGKNEKTMLLSLVIFHFVLEPFQPHFLPMIFTPKKRREGNCLVYFRFRSAQKVITPMMQATTTAKIIATSVVINGASVDSVGSGSFSGFLYKDIISALCQNDLAF